MDAVCLDRRSPEHSSVGTALDHTISEITNFLQETNRQIGELKKTAHHKQERDHRDIRDRQTHSGGSEEVDHSLSQLDAVINKFEDNDTPAAHGTFKKSEKRKNKDLRDVISVSRSECDAYNEQKKLNIPKATNYDHQFEQQQDMSPESDSGIDTTSQSFSEIMKRFREVAEHHEQSNRDCPSPIPIPKRDSKVFDKSRVPSDGKNQTEPTDVCSTDDTISSAVAQLKPMSEKSLKKSPVISKPKTVNVPSDSEHSSKQSETQDEGELVLITDKGTIKLDPEKIPGYQIINSDVPCWKKPIIEKKNREAVCAYKEHLIRDLKEQERLKTVPVWKRNLLERKGSINLEKKATKVEKVQPTTSYENIDKLPEWRKEQTVKKSFPSKS